MSKPLRVLLVEDEMCIAMMIEDMLADLGHELAGTAARLNHAVESARHCAADCAIIDVNLDGEMSFPVAAALADRGIPFVFATGYGPSIIEERYAAAPVLTKPFDIDRLEAALNQIAMVAAEPPGITPAA